MTEQRLARNLARRSVERTPLGDGEAGRPSRRGRVRLRRLRAHAVDEPQGSGYGRRDRELATAERAIEACEHRPIVGAQRSTHSALELSGESAQRSGTALRARRQIGRQQTEHLAVRGLDVDRDHRRAVGVGHRPVDEPPDVLLVETGQIGEHERRRRRGHGVVGGHAEEVVEERSAGLGDPLVTKREHQRRGARGSLDDAGAHAHAALAPAPQRMEVVLERRRGTAERGDDELDQRVEVDAHERVEGVDKLDRRLVGQLAGELHDRAVGAVLIIDHGSLPTLKKGSAPVQHDVGFIRASLPGVVKGRGAVTAASPPRLSCFVSSVPPPGAERPFHAPARTGTVPARASSRNAEPATDAKDKSC